MREGWIFSPVLYRQTEWKSKVFCCFDEARVCVCLSVCVYVCRQEYSFSHGRSRGGFFVAQLKFVDFLHFVPTVKIPDVYRDHGQSSHVMPSVVCRELNFV